MIHAVGTALGEIIQNLRRTVRLTLYENRSRRAGMLLGRWWDLLSPLLQILIYWFVFSVGLGTQEKNGFPYHLWLMCGMMPWLALNSAILGASASIQQAASIIRNVRIPLSIIPMKAVVRAYYEHLWTMAILLIALLLGGVSVTWHYLELSVLPRGFVGAADRRGAADEQPDGGLSRFRRAASAADAPAVLRFQRRVGN